MTMLRHKKSTGRDLSKPDRRTRPRLDPLEERLVLSGGSVAYSGPIVITSGGTYQGNWQSLDPNTPAVTIETTSPVIIEDSNIQSMGDLIDTAVDNTNVTIQDCNGYGLNPDVYGQSAGRFFKGQYFDNVDIENNYLQGTGGIYLLNYEGNDTPGQTVKVVANEALDIDGRKSDGAGGYLDFNVRTNKSTGATDQGYNIVQFLQMDKVRDVPGMEVAWNQVINQPGLSRVEDNINIYLSSGTASSPLLIHDNYIQGAYTVNPDQGNTSDSTYNYNWTYAGGGILLGDGVAGDAADASSYVEAYDNQVVSSQNYAIAIAAGHDNSFYDNRMVSSGLLSDGSTIYGMNSGAYIWNSYSTPSSVFYNDSGANNVVGWTQMGNRVDWWTPDASSWTGNVSMAGPITLSTEAAEYTLWLEKLAQADVTVGPISNQGALGDPGFESVVVGAGNDVVDPSGSAWAFAGSAGVSGNNSAITSNNPPAPEGNQVGFLEGTGSFSQVVNGWAAGTYTIAFESAVSSANWLQSFEVLVDGAVVGTFQPSLTTYQPFATVSFTVTAGSHTVAFQGQNTSSLAAVANVSSASTGGIKAALIDEVSIVPSTGTPTAPPTPTFPVPTPPPSPTPFPSPSPSPTTGGTPMAPTPSALVIGTGAGRDRPTVPSGSTASSSRAGSVAVSVPPSTSATPRQPTISINPDRRQPKAPARPQSRSAGTQRPAQESPRHLGS